MPNGKKHRVAGTVTGAAYAAYRARDERPGRILLRMIGGAIGGQIEGAMPDMLEPASWPGHRQVAHSLAAGAFVLIAPHQYITKWENRMSQYSSNLREKRLNKSNNPLLRFILFLGEIAFDILAGIPSGFCVGYASHIILDGAHGEVPILGNPEMTRLTRRLHNDKLVN